MKKIQFENEVSMATSSNGTASNISNRRSSSSSNKKLSCSSFSSSDDDDNDDDENGDAASQSKSKHSRPNTGKYDRKKSKQIKPSKDSENHVKNLRELQFKNKLLNTNNSNSNNQDVNNYDSTGNTHIHNDYENATSASDLNLMLKTAVNRNSLVEVESKSLLKNDLKLDLKLDLDDNDDDDDELDDDVLNSDESDEKPFANSRNISTVKVNQPRKPLDQSLNVNQKDSLTKISQKTQEEDKEDEEAFELRERAKSASSKVMSDREKRVSDLVNSIKQKQKQHEQKKQFYTDFKPYFIGSSLLLGGAILFQIYRSFFAKSI